MNHYRSYTENQMLFDTNINVLRLFIKWIGKILLRLPLLVAGYLITSYTLGQGNNLLLHLAFTITCAYITYLAIYFAKGVMISLKLNRSFWWVPILAIVVFFVCVLPILILLKSDFNIIKTINSTNYLPGIIVLTYSIYTFSCYRFLTDIAPRHVYTVYKAGIIVADKLFNFRMPRVVTKTIFGK
jgi:hypothetical protein